MAKDDLNPVTLDRLAMAIEAFEQASQMTRYLILAELLGTSAYVVEMTQDASKDAALNIVVATLEAKLGKVNSCGLRTNLP